MALTDGQRACIEMLDAPVAVSAGAGSGKTFTLTQRIIHAIKSGFASGIDDVLAITYTAKAANEIKSRVKGTLAAAGLTEQALRVDGAWISTIHSMCSRILREHALELGINPAFSVLSEAEAVHLRAKAIEEALVLANDMVSPGGLDALFAEYAVRSSGQNNISIESMLNTLLEAVTAHPRGFHALVMGPATQSPIVVLVRAADCLEMAAKLAGDESQGSTRDAFLEAATQAVAQARAALEKEVSAYEAMCLIAQMPQPGKNFGSRRGSYHLFVDEAQNTLAECLLEARLAAVEPVRNELIALARLVCSTYEQMKHEKASLDNNDLLVYVARAFDEHPEIARAYEGRFKVVMVDEFQDTDQVQINMIRRIAGEGWRLLCTVGDAQQSIYRFRGADLAVFRRHLADVGQQNECGLITLSDNFRSHKDVLMFVDRVFGQPLAFGKSFMSLSPARDETHVSVPFKSTGPRIDVLAVSYPYRGVGKQAAREVEAAEIANRLAALRDTGHAAGDMALLLGTMSNVDVFASALRARGLSSVVCKGSVFNRTPEVRTMVRLAYALVNPAHTAALFEVLSSGMFLLSADDFVVLSTYYDEARGCDRRRSIAEGFRDIMIALIGSGSEHKGNKDSAISDSSNSSNGSDNKGSVRTAESVCNGDNERESAKTACSGFSVQLEAAIRLFARAMQELGRQPLSHIMAKVVRDSGWLSRLETGGAEGQAVAGNVLKALRIVEDIEHTGAYGPLEIARRFGHAVDVSKEAPGALAVSGGDFVRIMTVHASKGLEFPIVAVAEMESPSRQSSKLICQTVDGALCVSLDAGYSADNISDTALLRTLRKFDLFEDYDEDAIDSSLRSARTAGTFRAALKARELAGAVQERKRLMYVALTRAKEALIIAMHGEATKKGGPLGRTTEPESACGCVVSTLFPDGMFAAGETAVDFGGSTPARATLITLEAGTVSLGNSAVCSTVSAKDVVYAPAHVPMMNDVPFFPVRTRVLSYSSLSAQLHTAQSRQQYHVMPAVPASEHNGNVVYNNDFAAPDVLSNDDEAWEILRTRLAGDDKATDLGTVFHRSAQLAVLMLPTYGRLCYPPSERIDALCRSYCISNEGRVRLHAALECWFASDLARCVALWPQVEAEVPFFTTIDIDGRTRFLEGEIDLLATEDLQNESSLTDESGEENLSLQTHAALIVDYKTGGQTDENRGDLHEKHRLQAMCYAYALLRHGYTKIDAVFVRVEHGSSSCDSNECAVCIDELGRMALPPSLREASNTQLQNILRSNHSAYDDCGNHECKRYEDYNVSVMGLSTIDDRDASMHSLVRETNNMTVQSRSDKQGSNKVPEPQYVCYSFSASDFDEITEAIATAYRAL